MSRSKISIPNEIRKEIIPQKSYLVAVSGGRDSMVLLHALNLSRRLLKIDIAVAHVDHRLRKNSHNDASFVRQTAKNLGFKFYLKKCRPKPKDANTEQWGRTQRYDFFKKLVKEKKINYILTAHNANDVAETFLMRLIANKELNTIERHDKERKLIRPLLSVSRETINEYVKSHKIRYCDDSSNDNQDFFRNKIRHDLLPYLEKNYDRRISEILAKRAAAVAEDIALIDKLLETHLQEVEKFSISTRQWLSTAKRLLAKLEPELKWRFVEKLLKSKIGYNLGRTKSRLILKIFEGEASEYELGQGLLITCKDGHFKFSRNKVKG